MGYAEYASQIIIYRTPYSEQFKQLIELAHKYNKTVFYDIDDLVYDTSYTDQLDYVKTLGKEEKEAYDSGVRSYGKLMELCDAFITSTTDLKNELLKLGKPVYLNRNLASEELISISEQAIDKTIKDKKKIKIGYFSGSITHNENFDLIRSAILKILKEFPQTELHLVGHLTIPDEMKNYKKQLIVHDFLDWTLLPSLVAEMDINLAPLVDNVFNRAKSEIKWLEAALVGVTTVASDIGSFSEIITASDTEWYEKLKELIISSEKREILATNALEQILKNEITKEHMDQLTEKINEIY